jgi:integrase
LSTKWYEDRQRWVVQFQPPKGRRRFKSFLKDQHNDARLWEAQQKALALAKPDLPRTTLFHEFAAIWLAEKQAATSVRASTAAHYRNVVSGLLSFIGPVTLGDIDRGFVRGVAHFLLTTGRLDNRGEPTGQKLSPSTLAVWLSVLSAMLEDGKRRGLIHTNPVAGLVGEMKLPRKRKAPVSVPTQTQVRAMLAELRDGEGSAPRVFPVAACMAMAGLRQGEAIALQHADLIGQHLVVSRTVSRLKDRAAINPTKSGTPRSAPLSPALRKILEAVPLNGTPWLFFPELETLTPKVVGRIQGLVDREVRKALRAVGSKGASHLLRHAFVSHALLRKMPLGYVQKWVGHHDPSVTASMYSHLLDAPVSAELDAMAGDFAPTDDE